MATAIAFGAGVTIAALAARAGLRAYAKSGLGSAMPSVSSSPFLRGGFEPTMSTREAYQILGINDTNAKADVIKKAHRSIMLANHPDRGGSPYIASKINEAKELLDGSKAFR
ncbi:hypothetical protein BC833DRAFT_578230 [Globomyces pollinis-pini]|nr:hypothetical protein BC833DRAFT_578230 [Globomyces pollinis-pini]